MNIYLYIFKKFFLLGVVGEDENNGDEISYYLFTHKKFDIGYNDKQIVDVNLTTNSVKVKLTPNAHITFTYEVNWKKSNVKFEDRFDKYLDPSFFQHRVNTIIIIFIYQLALLYIIIILYLCRYTGLVFLIVL